MTANNNSCNKRVNELGLDIFPQFLFLFLVYVAPFLLVGRLQVKTLKQLAIKSRTYNTHMYYTKRKPFKSRSFCTEPLKMAKSLHDQSSVFIIFLPTNNNYLNFNEVSFFF